MQGNSSSFSNIYNRVIICIRLTNILYSAEHTGHYFWRNRMLIMEREIEEKGKEWRVKKVWRNSPPNIWVRCSSEMGDKLKRTDRRTENSEKEFRQDKNIFNGFTLIDTPRNELFCLEGGCRSSGPKTMKIQVSHWEVLHSLFPPECPFSDPSPGQLSPNTVFSALLLGWDFPILESLKAKQNKKLLPLFLN